MIQRSEWLLRDRAVEGVIAGDTLLRDRWAIPTVSVSGHHEPKGVINIVLNHRLAAELAIDHLRGLGHKRLAFIKGQKFSSDTESRWRGIRHALRAAGLRVPQDVSVVGFDDVQSAAFQSPALTTVRQPLRTMGVLAAQTVLQQIGSASGGNAAQQIVVDPELVVRESTCPPGTGKR